MFCGPSTRQQAVTTQDFLRCVMYQGDVLACVRPHGEDEFMRDEGWTDAFREAPPTHGTKEARPAEDVEANRVRLPRKLWRRSATTSAVNAITTGTTSAPARANAITQYIVHIFQTFGIFPIFFLVVGIKNLFISKSGIKSLGLQFLEFAIATHPFWYSHAPWLQWDHRYRYSS